MNTKSKITITEDIAVALINEQFPQYKNLPIQSVKEQGHDNRTYRLGRDMLIRMPTAASYDLKVPKEHELLPQLSTHMKIDIPYPIEMGQPSNIYPFHFSIYKWLDGVSANQLTFTAVQLDALALELANFLKELQSISDIDGPLPGQHNWWRGDHISVYDKGAREQIAELDGDIDINAIQLWEQACDTRWEKSPVWIHGDFASGNILVKDNKLSGVIDFGGMAMGDPACDLVIAWTFLKGRSSTIFKQSIGLDADTWLRARAWALWKASFELCQLKDRNSKAGKVQKEIIQRVLDEEFE